MEITLANKPFTNSYSNFEAFYGFFCERNE